MKPAVRRIALGVAVLLCSSCGSSSNMSSQWNANHVKLDGQTDDWGSIYQLVPNTDLDFAVRNDADFLYVSVLTNNREVQRQLLWQGLILWIDASGGHDRSTGIRFPVGLSEHAPETDSPPALGDDIGRAATPDELSDRALQEVQIIRNGQRERSWAVVDLDAIRVHASLRESWFAYEMRIPLRTAGATGIAIGAGPGDIISLGLQTPDSDRQMSPEMMGDVAGDRNGPGGPGGTRGTRGAGDFGQGGASPAFSNTGPILPKEIDSWSSVKLAGPGTK